MAETVSSIGSGKDYSNLNTWEASWPGSIASGDQYVGEVYGEVVTATAEFETAVTYADSTARILLRAASGEETDGTAGSGAMLKSEGTNCLAILNEDINITISGLEFNVNSNSVKGLWALGDNSGTIVIDQIIENCIFYGAYSLSGSRGIDQISALTGSSSSVQINNCVFFDLYRSISGNSSSTAKNIVNYCTSHHIKQIGFWYCTTTNCLSTDADTLEDFRQGGGNYNISSDTTAPGANTLKSKISYTDYYTDAAGFDLTLKGTTDDGGIFGVTGLAGIPIAGITTDLTGKTRDVSDPDIGAFEFGAAPVASIIPQIMHHRQQQRSA